MTKNSKLLIAAAAATTILASSGAALAQDPPATSVTIREATTLKAGDTSPFDVGGVRAIRRGKAIPAGYVLPGRTVTIDASGPAGGAAIRFTCPGRKRLRSFAVRGDVGFSVTDARYPGRRSAVVISLGRSGRTSTGTIYAVCR